MENKEEKITTVCTENIYRLHRTCPNRKSNPFWPSACLGDVRV